MANPCSSPASCLTARRKALSLPVNDPRNWRNPCNGCLEGCARQMDSFTPEPDIPPSHKSAIIPWHVPVKRSVRHGLAHCSKCDCELSMSARYTGTSGMCMGCFRIVQKPPEKCVVRGCCNKSRRRGLCKKHIAELSDRGNNATQGPGKVRVGK